MKRAAHGDNRRGSAPGAMLRRDGGLFLRSLLGALLLTAVLLSLCAAVFAGYGGAEDRTAAPVPLGFYLAENSLFVSVAKNLLRQQPFLSSVFSLEEVRPEEARAKVEDGTFKVAIVVPVNFYEMAGNLETVTTEVYLSDSDPLAEEITRELILAGGNFISAGQYGATAGYRVLLSKGKKSLTDAYYAKISDASVRAILYSAGSEFPVEATDYNGTGLTVALRYLLLYFALFLELCTLGFRRLLCTDAEPRLAGRLGASGVSAGAFLAGKVLYPFLFRAAVTAGFFAVLSLTGVCSFSGIFLPLAAGLLTVSVTGCACMLLSRDGVAGSVLITVSGLAALVMGGGILPLSYLPVWLQTAGSLLPTGICLSGATALAGGASLTAAQWAAGALWTAVGAGVALLRVLRLRRGREASE